MNGTRYSGNTCMLAIQTAEDAINSLPVEQAGLSDQGNNEEARRLVNEAMEKCATEEDFSNLSLLAALKMQPDKLENDEHRDMIGDGNNRNDSNDDKKAPSFLLEQWAFFLPYCQLK